MIVSHRHRFIFLKTRKTAGSTLEVVLSRVCGPDDIVTPLGPKDEALRLDHGPRNYRLPMWRWPLNGLLKELRGRHPGTRWTGHYPHMRAKAVRRLVGEEVWSSYYKITSERNPWDRQVSLYYWRMRNMADPPSFEQYLRGSDRRALRLGNFDIYSIGGRVIVDDVILYHDMRAGLERIFDRLAIPLPDEIPGAKTGIRPGSDYRTYYTEETRELIARCYAREIDVFGFSFDGVG